MTAPIEPDPVAPVPDPDQLSGRSAAAKLRGQELAAKVGELAGAIAETEDEVARTHEKIAADGVSATAPGASGIAREAREFAESERREQQRWSEEADGSHRD